MRSKENSPPIKGFVIYFIIVLLIMLYTLIATVSGSISRTFLEFAVDADSNIYLYRPSCIEVLDSEGETVRNIDITPFTSRGYSFTISTDNNLIISTGVYLYTTDLQGNVIEKNK